MSLEDVVTVNISVDSSTPARANFGLPLYAVYHTNWAERFRIYSSLQGLLDDGFTVNDPAYKMAANHLAQEQHFNQFAIGRRALPFTKSWEITPTDTTEGLVNTISIDGEVASYTNGAAETVAGITAGLQTAIAALTTTSAVTAVDNTTNVGLTADVAGEMPYLSAISSTLFVQDVTADPGIATDLAAILAENTDWYGMDIDSRGKAEIVAAATWLEAFRLLFVTSSIDHDIIEQVATTDVLSTLGTATLARTAIMYHGRTDEWPGAAWMGLQHSKNPGSSTWHLKELRGISVDTLTESHKTALRAKEGNWYIECNGLNRTFNGKTAAGEFIDIIRGVDWLDARLAEEAFDILASNEKVPFTDSGILLLEGGVRSVLELATDNAVLADDPPFTVTSPAALDVPKADRDLRCLNTIDFQGRLAGAIHKLTITGSVST